MQFKHWHWALSVALNNKRKKYPAQWLQVKIWNEELRGPYFRQSLSDEFESILALHVINRACAARASDQVCGTLSTAAGDLHLRLTHALDSITPRACFGCTRKAGRAASMAIAAGVRSTQKFMDFGARALPRRRYRGCAAGALSQSSYLACAKGGEWMGDAHIVRLTLCWGPGLFWCLLSAAVCVRRRKENSSCEMGTEGWMKSRPRGGAERVQSAHAPERKHKKGVLERCIRFEWATPRCHVWIKSSLAIVHPVQNNSMKFVTEWERESSFKNTKKSKVLQIKAIFTDNKFKFLSLGKCGGIRVHRNFLCFSR